MKIVLDTNIYLAALLFEGKVATLYDKIMEEHDVFVSPFIFAELSDKLITKFKISPEEVTKISQSILLATIFIDAEGEVPDTCRDPDDNHILHLADIIKADLIITGDKDLLVLKQCKTTRIISPSEFA